MSGSENSLVQRHYRFNSMLAQQQQLTRQHRMDDKDSSINRELQLALQLPRNCLVHTHTHRYTDTDIGAENSCESA